MNTSVASLEEHYHYLPSRSRILTKNQLEVGTHGNTHIITDQTQLPAYHTNLSFITIQQETILCVSGLRWGWGKGWGQGQIIKYNLMSNCLCGKMAHRSLFDSPWNLDWFLCVQMKNNLNVQNKMILELFFLMIRNICNSSHVED